MVTLFTSLPDLSVVFFLSFVCLFLLCVWCFFHLLLLPFERIKMYIIILLMEPASYSKFTSQQSIHTKHATIINGHQSNTTTRDEYYFTEKIIKNHNNVVSLYTAFVLSTCFVGVKKHPVACMHAAEQYTGCM